MTIWRLLFAPSAAFLLGATPLPPAVHDGGICVGLGWLTLEPGERVDIEHGPDFYVFYFSKPGDEAASWGVYWGWAAQVRGSGSLLLKRDGVKVNRAGKANTFQGYLAQRGKEQNHFFGAAFKGTKADKAFFDRLNFRADGETRCGRALTT